MKPTPVTAAALAAFLTVAPPAPSGPPGQWTRITALTSRNIDEPAIARTPDGALHVLWLRANGTDWDLVHSAIDAGGHVAGTSSDVVIKWNTLSNPHLLAERDRLRAFVRGIRGSAPGDPFDGAVYTATAPFSGAAWTLANDGVSQSKNASAPGASFTADGTPAVAWATSFDLLFHVGLNGGEDQRITTTGCCTYDPALATDAESGELVLGWYSNADKEHGLYTQTVAPTMGERRFIPGSANGQRTMSLSLDQRMPLAARHGTGGGVFAAYCSGYPSCSGIRLWRHGASDPIDVGRASGARLVNVGPGPEGRLWVMWAQGGGDRLRATRTNRAATHVGPVVSVAPPPGTSNIWKVKGDGANGRLDLLAAVTTPEGLATWHTQVLPALSLTARPARFMANDTVTVVFQVTDAGDPAPGATVEVDGERRIADAGGRVSVRFTGRPAAGQIPATATLDGYTEASTSVTVTPPPPTRRRG